MNRSKAYLYLHIAVFLFGFTAILGKEISLSAASMTWYRMVITLVSLCFIPKIFRHLKAIPPKARRKSLFVGLLVASHWVTFFGAIKLSNVSIALSCMASAAFFTSLVEPIILKRPFKLHEAMLGGLVVVGFIFIFGYTGEEMYAGIIVAILSAFLAALFGTFNKTLVEEYDVYAVTLLEFVAGVSFLSILLPIYMWFSPEPLNMTPTLMDWGLLFVLALVCTTLAFTLTMHALRHLSAFATALALNLEPIYAILMAWFFYQENKELNTGFYVGACIIILAVFLNPFLEQKMSKLPH